MILVRRNAFTSYARMPSRISFAVGGWLDGKGAHAGVLGTTTGAKAAVFSCVSLVRRTLNL